MLKDVKKLLRARDLIIKTEGKIKKKSFKLNFKVSNNSDRNSKKNLLILRERIIKNVKKLKLKK